MHVSIQASKQIIKSLVKYVDPYASQGQLRKHILTVFTQGQLRKHILTLFTVIALTLLTSGPSWETDFAAIYGNPAIYV